MKWISENTPLLRQFILYLETMAPEVFGQYFQLDKPKAIELAKDDLLFSYIYKIGRKLYDLTMKECMTLVYLSEGFTPKTMSRLTGNSPRTHQTHLFNIYQKVGCNSKEQLKMVFDRLLAV